MSKLFARTARKGFNQRRKKCSGSSVLKGIRESVTWYEVEHKAINVFTQHYSSLSHLNVSINQRQKFEWLKIRGQILVGAYMRAEHELQCKLNPHRTNDEEAIEIWDVKWNHSTLTCIVNMCRKIYIHGYS